jgi:hypothetical protein
MTPVVAVKDMTTMREDMVAAPDTEPNACLKIDMIGYMGFSARAMSRSDMQYNTTIIIANPRAPLIRILRIIDFGTTIGALWISSAMCIAASPPI